MSIYFMVVLSSFALVLLPLADISPDWAAYSISLLLPIVPAENKPSAEISYKSLRTFVSFCFIFTLGKWPRAARSSKSLPFDIKNNNQVCGRDLIALLR